MITAMPRYVVPLRDATNPVVSGQKAAALAHLIRCGECVPPGFVVTVAGCETKDEDVLEKEIEAALNELSGAVAVRSSACAEDLEDASFAGQYETFLNVNGPAEVFEAFRSCYTSASADRVSAYTRERGRSLRRQSMAVLVQQMVHADASGVAFSIDPRTGDDRVLVSAVAGIGARLVSGETSADEWMVTNGEATALKRTHDVIPESTVLEIAELVCRVAKERGAPQDVEWAIARGALYVLQARPITALPIRPELDVPAEGSWTKDMAHSPELLTPFGADLYLPLLNYAIQCAAEEFGVLIKGIEYISLGGEVYSRARPLVGREGPNPPWWILAIACRAVPVLRSRCRAAAQMVRSGKLEDLSKQWESEWKPMLETQIAQHLEIELSELTDRDLLAELDQLVDLLRRGEVIHFQLCIPYAVSISEFVQECECSLGWPAAKALELFSGLSPTSSGPSRDLGQLAGMAASSSIGMQALAEGDLDRLRSVNTELFDGLVRYRNRWGWRALNYEPGSVTLAERPDMLCRSILDRIEAERKDPDFASLRSSRLREAYSQMRSQQHRRRFDELFEKASRFYPVREDNVRLTDNLPSGLIRRLLLEVGRRLTDCGHLRRAQDAVWLRETELRNALSAVVHPGLQARVDRRRAEQKWVSVHPGPAILGVAPSPTPDLRGVPSAARRINEAVLWGLQLELGIAPAIDDEVVSGISVCGGKCTGTVRVIGGESDFARLHSGDVLVCKVATPAWSALFGIAGAVVTDLGSPLSHTAIVAREHGVPAIVATGNATEKLRDGEIVTVDGTRGRVTLESMPVSQPDRSTKLDSKTIGLPSTSPFLSLV
jgi:rifampicin phosphotransferase